jgi:hypothetical protein
MYFKIQLIINSTSSTCMYTILTKIFPEIYALQFGIPPNSTRMLNTANMGKAIIQCTPAYLAGKEKPYFAVSVTHAELSRSVRIAHGKSNLGFHFGSVSRHKLRGSLKNLGDGG